MGPMNIAGTNAPQGFDIPTLDELEFQRTDSKVRVVDASLKEEFTRGHLSGSLAIEMQDDFGVWVA